MNPEQPLRTLPSQLVNSVQVGMAIPELRVRITPEMLVRYAGASNDFNPIHWSASAAARMKLPGVIAHGMLTLGMALRVVTDWIKDSGRILSISTRFAKPVVLTCDEGTEVTFSAEITALHEGVATIALKAQADGQNVLTQAKVQVRVD